MAQYRNTWFNEKLTGGSQALTTQSFTELNSKRGLQYEASFYSASVAEGSSVDIIFTVGPTSDVLVKDIEVMFNSDVMQSAIYHDPTYTGGSEIAVYNLNNRDAVADDVTILGGSTVTDEGTQISATTTTIGTQGQGNRSSSTVNLNPHVERVLARGETYLYRVTNVDGGTASISGIATWYQGVLSTEV